MYNCIVEYTADSYLRMLVLYSHKRTCTGSVRRKGGKRGRGRETIEREREGKRERRKGERGREEIINHMIVRSRLITAE